MGNPFVIETAALTKTYAGVQALRGLDLQVPAGSICGFLGRNGAGKTTALKVLLGMARATSGSATVFGLDAGSATTSVDIRRRVGFVSEEKDLYPYMTVDETIRFTSAFYPTWRQDLARQYLRSFDLLPQKRVKTLSRGARAKLALLLALCRGAHLLVLDEPTSGLDPAATEEVLQALVSHVAGGETTVFFSSHQIAQVDQIADHVVIIHRGRSVLSGALDDLRESFNRVQLVFAGEAPETAFRAPGVRRVQRSGRVLMVLSSAAVDTLLDEARALAPAPVSIEVTPVTLKEIFLETTASEG